MKLFLREYDVVLRTVGPVFIGSGREIGKKEYLFWNQDKVAIPDMHKFYFMMQKRGIADAFENYLISGSRDDLTRWLQKQGIKKEELTSVVKYQLDCGDAVIEKGRTIQLMECMKNPYGKPYIPGTSLKGMFRTIFLCQDIIENPQKYQQEKNSMRREILQPDNFKRINRNTFLKRNVGEIENKRYRTLKKNEKKANDAVNDLMQGFVVSDSEPLSVDNLVLCQKVDKYPDGTEKTLPILRECIKPGTEIHFSITVDTSIFRFDETMLKEAIQMVMENYYKNFQKAFSGFEKPKSNYLFLGGGSGFVSKTIIYAMYDQRDGIDVTQHIFEKTKVPRIHKHDRDKKYGASPHILKCTKYGGSICQMGLCEMEKMELISK